MYHAALSTRLRVRDRTLRRLLLLLPPLKLGDAPPIGLGATETHNRGGGAVWSVDGTPRAATTTTTTRGGGNGGASLRTPTVEETRQTVRTL